MGGSRLALLLAPLLLVDLSEASLPKAVASRNESLDWDCARAPVASYHMHVTYWETNERQVRKRDDCCTSQSVRFLWVVL
jgi:hypothetical protein